MKNKSKILLFILFTMVILLNPFSASAQYNDEPTTAKEQAVFAFFSALHAAPDYDFWITSHPEFDDLTSTQKQKYLLKETLRLGRGYGMFDQERDMLELKINVLAKYVSATDDEGPHIKFTFFDNTVEYTPTFNYPYGKDVLSLVINHLATFSNLTLTESQSDAIIKKIPYRNEEFEATLTVHVRVGKVNYKYPIKSKPVKQWLMVGDVAYLRCDVLSYVSSEENKLWDYVAPWYAEAYRIKNMPEEEKYPHPFDLFKD